MIHPDAPEPFPGAIRRGYGDAKDSKRCAVAWCSLRSKRAGLCQAHERRLERRKAVFEPLLSPVRGDKEWEALVEKKLLRGAKMVEADARREGVYVKRVGWRIHLARGRPRKHPKLAGTPVIVGKPTTGEPP